MAGENNSRITPLSKITLQNIREGSIFLRNLAGGQLLAGALWGRTLLEREIEELTLEDLTRLL